MEKKITKRVAVPLEDSPLFRETIIELVQTYDDNTKKLKGTKEKSRTEGKTLRVVKAGEKPDMQLMNEDTFEVLSLVVEKAPAKPEAPPPPTPAPEPPAPEPPAPEPEPTPEPTVAEAGDESPPPQPAGEEGSEDASSDTTDDSTEEEDDMAKQKAAKATKKKVAKKAAPKKAKAAAKSNGNGEKKAPASGQSGPSLNLKDKPLNPKEEKVLGALSNGAGQLTLTELGALFKGKKKSQANSWARNSLRRLVRGGLVKKVGRGTYEATAKGKKRAEA
jgi:hypothetical protein